MRRITAGDQHPLHDTAATRRAESAPRTFGADDSLMQRAGLATARLAMAIAPHARTVWIACGPGNNGGDGWEAAVQLRMRGISPWVTFCGDDSRLPPDARAARARAQQAGVRVAPVPPTAFDLCIDALLGIGATRNPDDAMASWMTQMNDGPGMVLSVDVPSGLDADTGARAGVMAHHTLSLLTLKPGLFTAQGRDAAGTVWLDTLGVDLAQSPASALLSPAPPLPTRPHASHKGSYGDVAVVGGAAGMTGAALLAARAALHHGAGRVFVALLDEAGLAMDPAQPELMLRKAPSLELGALTVVCGCGGGEAIRPLLPRVLSSAHRLVLDADALNCVAADSSLQTLLARRGQRGAATVLTPHPLEAARLLGLQTGVIQSDRLQAARQLVERFGCVTVLKGSGTVIAAPGAIPKINPTGNARLATAGTGDVLAGMIGARLAHGEVPETAAAHAVYLHGEMADRWPAGLALTASQLA